MFAFPESRAKRALLIALVLVVALGLFFALLESDGELLENLLSDEQPGEHTLASGAFAKDADVRQLCSSRVERSVLWQAYLGQALKGPSVSRPVLRFALKFQRDPDLTVRAWLTIKDARGKQLYDAQDSVRVSRRVLKWKGIPLCEYDPGETDYNDGEAWLLRHLEEKAVLALMDLRPENGNAYIPALLARLRWENKHRSTYTAASGNLVEKYSGFRDGVLDELAKLCRHDASRVAFLVQALDDPDPWMRRDVIQIVGKLKAAGKDAAPKLARCLKDEQQAVRQAAAWALGDIGPEAQAAAPELVAALTDVEAVRSSALRSLLEIAPEKKARSDALIGAVPALRVLLTNPDLMVRRSASLVLARLGYHAAPAAPELAAALKDADSYNRELAAKALGKICATRSPEETPYGAVPPSESLIVPDAATLRIAVPALAAALKDDAACVAHAAVESLRLIGGPALPALIAAVQSNDVKVATSAAQALGHMGRAAESAAVALRQAAQAKDRYLKRSAEEALKAIESAK